MELIQVLQSYSIIGLQVFGEVKHMKTSFSLLAYVNRFVVWNYTIKYAYMIFMKNLPFPQLYQPPHLRIHVQEFSEKFHRGLVPVWFPGSE